MLTLHGWQVEQAASVTEMALKYQPHNSEALLLLTAAQVELGLERRARATAEFVTEGHPSVDIAAWLRNTLTRATIWSSAGRSTSFPPEGWSLSKAYPRSMSYPWIRFLHIASAIGFVAVHGASIVVLYAIRNEGDRGRIESLMAFSAKTVVAMYLSLTLVIGTGFWLGFVVPAWFSQPWYWLSLALLALTTVLMWFVARPFGKRVRAACEIRPSGVPRASDEELSQILRSQRTNLITLIGVAGLGAVLYLMVFKPVL